LERLASAESDHVLAVSRPLKERILAMGSLSPDAVTVVPCCVNPSLFRFDEAARDELRTRLNLRDSFALAYSGSLSPWQNPARIAALVTELRRRTQATRLLLLTRDDHGARRYFQDLLDDGGCVQVACRFEEVGRYLSRIPTAS